MGNKRVVFFTSEDAFEASQYKDLKKDKRIEYVAGLFRGSNKLYNIARRISKREHQKLRHKIFLFLYSVFFSKLREYATGADAVIFTNPAILGMSPFYYNLFFAIHKKARPALVIIDVVSKPMGCHAKRIADASKKTQCFSFDQRDAEKFGYKHMMCSYSKYDVEPTPTNSDIYFVGYAADKLPMLQALGNKFSENGITASINVLGVKPDERKAIEGINYLDQYKQYDEVVVETNASNCILEVVQKGQTGATLRYYEALCYNKKLLTTNVYVAGLPFYDPNYMKVFQNIDEIDVDWIKSKAPVDYHYDGRFSPINMITEILEAI